MTSNQPSPYIAYARLSKPLWGKALRSEIAKTPATRPSLIDEILPERSIIMVASPPGQGKSCLLLTLAAQASLGQPVFGHLACARPLRIYILCPERGSLELFERLRRMEECGLQYSDSLCLDGGMVGRVDIANAASLKLITDGIKEFASVQKPPGVDLVCFEGMYGMSRKPLASEEAANDFARFNASLQQQFGCALWYSHHTRKAARNAEGEELPLVWFGSQMLMAQVTGAYIFERMRDSRTKSVMRNQKDTVSGLAAELMFEFDAESFTLALGRDLGLLSNFERLRFYVNGCYSSGRMFTYHDICVSTDLSQSSCQRWVVTQVKAGYITNTKQLGARALYRVLAPIPTSVTSACTPIGGGSADQAAVTRNAPRAVSETGNGHGNGAVNAPDFSVMDAAAIEP